ncbi:hypothetical protein CFC21_102583 [Triticum aestivum]|uniref:Uncharacterized protein n=3 Tax=Triticum TaxID=4564 RepID=A0A9R1BZ20_TRITD|nr:uncharacterized protein LOC123156615 [Triticum aestivum]KAF7101191.1 hypothetical protein CFC21_102583 [Triticum aestivum]VAI86413.1 unnamed protein product [Triticum turgidum subsp. durum]
MPDLSPSKGVLSCLYSRCDSASQSKGTHKLLFDLILDYYDKAVDRLPVKEMPPDVDLLRLVEGSGFCFGLLDPVSNIIFNTISVLPHDIGATPKPSSPCRKKSKRTLPKITRKPKWDEIASKSYKGLIDFMLSYFGCLSKDQAARYLFWSSADVSLAVMLVEYEFGTDNPLLPYPGSERTQAALKMAALGARHTAPDSFVRFVTSQYPRNILLNSARVLADSGRKLHIADVKGIVDLVHSLDTPCYDAKVALLPNGRTVCYVQKITFHGEVLAAEAVTSKISDLGDGYSSSSTTTTLCPAGYHITYVRHIGLERLSYCLSEANAEKHRLNAACGNSCEYLQSLKMRLLQYIQTFYLTVFSRLPAGCEHLIRSILVAGHCYGPMDPVSNVIISSIWYDRWCPLPEADRKGIQAYDILNTCYMLRTQARSLKGLLCLACALDPTLTEECAAKALRDNTCDLFGKLSGVFPLGSGSSNIFHMAAKAAGHPLPAGLGLLYQQLAQVPARFAQLSSLITSSRVLSPDVCNQIAAFLEGEFKITPHVQNELQAQAPKLCKEALKTLSRKRSGHGCKTEFIRFKLAQLLDKYASEHPWEPKYVLNFICGVEERGPLFTVCYRVNFMATPESQDENTLFFAEFWVSYPQPPKPNFCCPLQQPYSGRCYFGEASARKIVYPCSTEYFMSDITAYGTKDAEDILDTDFVYFDSRRDLKFATDVNSYYAPGFPVLSRPIVLATDEELKMLGP